MNLLMVVIKEDGKFFNYLDQEDLCLSEKSIVN